MPATGGKLTLASCSPSTFWWVVDGTGMARHRHPGKCRRVPGERSGLERRGAMEAHEMRRSAGKTERLRRVAVISSYFEMFG